MYNYHLSYKLSNTELSETIVLQKAKKCLVEISFSLNFRIKYVQVVKTRIIVSGNNILHARFILEYVITKVLLFSIVLCNNATLNRLIAPIIDVLYLFFQTFNHIYLSNET